MLDPCAASYCKPVRLINRRRARASPQGSPECKERSGRTRGAACGSEAGTPQVRQRPRNTSPFITLNRAPYHHPRGNPRDKQTEFYDKSCRTLTFTCQKRVRLPSHLPLDGDPRGGAVNGIVEDGPVADSRPPLSEEGLRADLWRRPRVNLD